MKIISRKLSSIFAVTVLSVMVGQVAFAKKPDKGNKPNDPKVPIAIGDVVRIEGQAIQASTFITNEGAEIKRYHISRPTLANHVNARDAYLTACIGPDEQTCADSGYELVFDPASDLGSFVDTYGEVESIWVKRYYTTYYLSAVNR